MGCTSCPRNCGADRDKGPGFCGADNDIKVAKAFLHKWEEPCISGVNGSGAVFFSGCNLKCVFCQNYYISQDYYGKSITAGRLGSIILSLIEKGAHNINLVSPTHHMRSIRQCLVELPDLNVPVIYNSNGYESHETLALAEGVIDVFLPDLKYFSPEFSLKYSGAADYFEKASGAVLEMYRQAGPPVIDESGMIRKGLMIRHLVLPGCVNDSIKVLKWIRDNLPGSIYVSLMSQYLPCHKASGHPEINRRLTRREYEKVLDCFYKLGFENGYVQERESAVEEYIPEFDLEGI